MKIRWAEKCSACGAPQDEVMTMFAVMANHEGAALIPFITNSLNGHPVFLAGGPRASEMKEASRGCTVCSEMNAGTPEAEDQKQKAIGPRGLVEWACRPCFMSIIGAKKGGGHHG